MGYVVLGLILLAVPFVLPIAGWIYGLRTRRRVERLEGVLQEQRATIDRLEQRIVQLRRELRTTSGEAAAIPEPSSIPEVVTPPGPALPAAHPPPAAPAPAAPSPRPAQPAIPPPRPVAEPAAPSAAVPDVAVRPEVAEPIRPAQPGVAPAAAPSVAAATPPGATVAAPGAVRPPTPPARRLPPPSPREPVPPRPPFDWESLVGVKLFSAIAGIALVLAAVFFLRYSIEHGWLQPPVRVLIGVAVSVALLLVCELKAARRYPHTANALDAAAIAILFSTFFAAHALWNLIPAAGAFVLLAVTTALAVLLSIRRASLFIAVLGLLGGFATPALLSTGENRPIPLFAYLMLLNIGLAWVAYRQAWSLLTILTLVFTTIYQWAWVLRFLDQTQLPLAMAIFLVFPVAAIAGLVLARPARGRLPEKSFERTALIGAVLPMFFAAYIAATPAYGARPWLLFGFLLLVDAGMLAVALMRGEEILHAAGAGATVLVMAAWLSRSYTTAGSLAALSFTVILTLFFLGAPIVARRVHRPLIGEGQNALYASPLLLFVPTVLVWLEPSFAAPILPLGLTLALVATIAWRAVAERRGILYFIAAFFAIAIQAVWSVSYLRPANLETAVLVYAAFGIVSLAVPLVARRAARPLEPEAGGGVVLIASLGVLLFLTSHSIAPAALWALALLLAILNAGLFVESAAGGLPLLSVVGSMLSWMVLASWWAEAGGAVGVFASLTVLTGLTLLTLGGHAWGHHRWVAARAVDPMGAKAGFARGIYLGLIGHLFLLFVSTNREWSVPPWPIFGTLAVLTLATSAISLAVQKTSLHAAGVVAAATIVAVWAGVAGMPPWLVVAIVASGLVSAYALGWMSVADRVHGAGGAAAAAAAALFIGEVTALNAYAGRTPPFAAVAVAHVVNLAVILALAWRRGWRHVALAAAVVGGIAQAQITTPWSRQLVLAAAIYVVFTAYPFIVGRRATAGRDPYLSAILASVIAFFSARAALVAGGYTAIVGSVPVLEAGVLALLLRNLLQTERGASRDLGRLALVAGASLAFVTVAIPVQLKHQWITIGWALEGTALAWLYRRVPHKGLLVASTALLVTVFVRLSVNPQVFLYEPRGATRVLNWYLYAYTVSAAALLTASWWLSQTDDRPVQALPRISRLLPAGAIILLFLLLNIEIADFYASEPTVTFHFGVSLSQDLTYTIGWLAFGMLLLGAGIYASSHAARVAALALIAVTTFKCFLYDLRSLGGLYRVASFVGLALSLALVSVALQRFVLAKQKEAA